MSTAELGTDRIPMGMEVIWSEQEVLLIFFSFPLPYAHFSSFYFTSQALLFFLPLSLSSIMLLNPSILGWCSGHTVFWSWRLLLQLISMNAADTFLWARSEHLLHLLTLLSWFSISVKENLKSSARSRTPCLTESSILLLPSSILLSPRYDKATP